MADVVSPETRSQMMSGIRGQNTKPELLVRKGLFSLGFRYRLHDRRLPGRPDIVLPKYRVAIFVHGCFWHLHGCALSKVPATRTEWWTAKLQRNRDKDYEAVAELEELGWRVLTIWECSFRGKGKKPREAVIPVVQDAARWITVGRLSIQIPINRSVLIPEVR